MKKIILFIFPLLLFSSYIDYKNKFIINNSYTIDPYNNNRVTSESQGYSMIIAVLNNDKKLFDSLWQWTKNNLQKKDYLFAWNWKKMIKDYNNATDGDILITYALIKAYNKWKNIYYLNEAYNILNTLKKLILNVSNNNYILYPSKEWFAKNNYLLIYPSYYIPFAFREFYNLTLDNIWKTMYLYTYKKIYHIQNISTKLKFDLIDKNFKKLSCSNMDVYRMIPYALIDKYDISFLNQVFNNVNEYFKKYNYIPLKFEFNGNHIKKEAPYCVYEWFYILYNNKEYLKKAKNLKKYDKENYFCEAINNLMKGIE